MIQDRHTGRAILSQDLQEMLEPGLSARCAVFSRDLQEVQNTVGFAGSAGFCQKVLEVPDLAKSCCFLQQLSQLADGQVPCKKGKKPISSCSTHPSCRSNLCHGLHHVGTNTDILIDAMLYFWSFPSFTVLTKSCTVSPTCFRPFSYYCASPVILLLSY